MNDFDQQLAYSEQSQRAPFWDRVYRAAFPNMIGMVANDRSNVGQWLGIDRWVTLGNGKVLSFDEKHRSEDYGDVLLEHISNDKKFAATNGKKGMGWIEKDLPIDYLAYAVMPAERCWFYPWLTLRRAWLTHKSEWLEYARARRHGFEIIPARNPNYVTLSVAVPHARLADALVEAVFVDLKVAA